ncbi:bifunctional adenosylcobinamide kinase/adenosylcobinamide-phosphate guanylyltransferase [Candidatus Rariloculus sp.]|uniref:bifunctional adenosylcobinamide kinase/adenosylcobinamide-phosphate guanylyltransferase n=1 Tax=Candidatus Rariloculus sp. TaxID=3101265 RepID=UPI003D0959AD
MKTIFVTGGARSGKSSRALRLAEEIAPKRVFIATAERSDAEMAERIERHRAARGSGFATVEAPLDLVEALEAAVSPDGVVLVDCLTLWLSNLMHYGRDVDAQIAMLTGLLARIRGPVILVSNEVGMGLVPTTPLGRAFRDAQGKLNQSVAAVCQRVEFMVAGLPLTVKPAQPGTASGTAAAD